MNNVIDMAAWKQEKAQRGYALAVAGMSTQIGLLIDEGLTLTEARNLAVDSFAAGMVSAGSTAKNAKGIAKAIGAVAMFNHNTQ